MDSGQITTTPIAVSVHKKGQSPIYSEGAIIVTIMDEGGGPFLMIQNVDQTSELQVDVDELEAVTEAARQLLKQHDQAEVQSDE